MSQSVQRVNFLTPILEESYRIEYQDTRRHNIRFSDAGAAAPYGERCEREIVYDLLDTKHVEKDGKPPIRTLLTSGSLSFFSDGRLFEADLRRRLLPVLRSAEREVLDPQVQVGGFPARGKIDNLAILRAIKARILQERPDFDPELLQHDPIVEIKTVNQYQYDEMARSGRLLQSYYDQVQKYLSAKLSPWALVVVKNRNGFGEFPGALPVMEFLVLPDAARYAAIQKGLRLTAVAAEESLRLDRNTVPRPFERESSKCQMCRFKRECWGPDPAPPAPVAPDATIDAPSQELLESAARVWKQNDEQVQKLNGEKDEAKGVLERYFKATGATELVVGDVRIIATRPSKSFLDDEVVRQKLGKEEYAKVSRAIKSELERAIQERLIDATVLAEATKALPNGELSLRKYDVKPRSQRVAVLEEKTKKAKKAKAKKEKRAWRGTGSKRTLRSGSTKPTSSGSRKSNRTAKSAGSKATLSPSASTSTPSSIRKSSRRTRTRSRT